MLYIYGFIRLLIGLKHGDSKAKEGYRVVGEIVDPIIEGVRAQDDQAAKLMEVAREIVEETGTEVHKDEEFSMVLSMAREFIIERFSREKIWDYANRAIRDFETEFEIEELKERALRRERGATQELIERAEQAEREMEKIEKMDRDIIRKLLNGRKR